MIEEIWDSIVDGFDYFIHFEWIGDIGEFFSEAFSNLGEFSTFGLAFGVLAVIVSYATRFVNLNGSGMGIIESMTAVMPPTQRIVWTILSYLGAFAGGYFMGNYFENS